MHDASMEPTSFNVGDVGTQGRTARLGPLQWSRRLSTSETNTSPQNNVGVMIASMEPTSFNVGDGQAAEVDAGKLLPLQWSRRLSTSETELYL